MGSAGGESLVALERIGLEAATYRDGLGLTAAVERMRAGDHPDLTIALSGVSMLNNAFAEAGQQDSATLMPLMFVVLIVFTIVVLRSVAGTSKSMPGARR